MSKHLAAKRTLVSELTSKRRPIGGRLGLWRVGKVGQLLWNLDFHFRLGSSWLFALSAEHQTDTQEDRDLEWLE